MSEIRSQATPARDSGLTDALRDAVGDNYDHGRNSAALLWHEDGIRDAIDWAGAARDLEREGWSKPRTVNSVEELEALPPGSVIKLPDGEVGMIMVARDKRHVVGYPQCLPTSELAEVIRSTYGDPIRVLFTPGDAG